MENQHHPRCLAGINKNNLGVIYKNNKRAWMTSNIFEDWLLTINKKFKNEKRNVLLFLDNFSGHNSKLVLSNIKLVYFPPNTTSKLQRCVNSK